MNIRERYVDIICYVAKNVLHDPYATLEIVTYT